MFCIFPKKKTSYDVEELLDSEGKVLISSDGSKLCAVFEYEFTCFLWFKFNKKII